MSSLEVLGSEGARFRLQDVGLRFKCAGSALKGSDV